MLLASAFQQQPHAFPSEHGGAETVCRGNAPAQGIVLAAEDLALGLAVFACAHYRHLGQLVPVVVAVVLFGVAAYAFSDQAAKAVVVVAFVLQNFDAVVRPLLHLLKWAFSSQVADALTTSAGAFPYAR